MEGLTEGRIVHFVMPGLMHRPAIVVRVWDREAGTVNLQVFTDGTNDRDGSDGVEKGIIWRTSVRYDEAGDKPYTWHWIERA